MLRSSERDAMRCGAGYPTVLAVGNALTAEEIDAGIAFSALAESQPQRLEVLQPVGTVRDAWVVFGCEPVDEGQPVVWLARPVARQFQARRRAVVAAAKARG